jgi:hypothetical protein
MAGREETNQQRPIHQDEDLKNSTPQENNLVLEISWTFLKKMVMLFSKNRKIRLHFIDLEMRTVFLVFLDKYSNPMA